MNDGMIFLVTFVINFDKLKFTFIQLYTVAFFLGIFKILGFSFQKTKIN